MKKSNNGLFLYYIIIFSGDKEKVRASSDRSFFLPGNTVIQQIQFLMDRLPLPEADKKYNDRGDEYDPHGCMMPFHIKCTDQETSA